MTNTIRINSIIDTISQAWEEAIEDADLEAADAILLDARESLTRNAFARLAIAIEMPAGYLD